MLMGVKSFIVSLQMVIDFAEERRRDVHEEFW